ncbi:protein translocase subunit SecF [Patescibacteria group bacterium]|nr:protein translocase subunit SecF [Patescibacteria group bacterium]MBU1721780.1 protein translocase subunit SecF [Patescibacteria group bacterium]MBU1901381.1 protein translocase subunit SecF [Patescibacteria group bacterium]
MINIIEKRRIPFIISSIVFAASLLALLVYGLKPGIDFTGGSLMEVQFTAERPAVVEVEEVLAPFELGNIVVQPANDDSMIIKMRFISEDEHQEILAAMRAAFAEESVEDVAMLVTESDTEVVVSTEGGETGVVAVTAEPVASEEEVPVARVLEKRVETIGGVISSELQRRSWQAGIAVVLAIIVFVAYAFRRVTKPVSSWKYGITAIVALIHDVVITMGIFALLGKFYGIEIDVPFVVAMLTILGYSVNDTIVVFDRVREKLIKRGRSKFAETVNMGVNETLVRSINTSITTLVVLFGLFIFGGDSIHYFSLALIIGIMLGTYSSIFLASPLLVVWERMADRK